MSTDGGRTHLSLLTSAVIGLLVAEVVLTIRLGDTRTDVSRLEKRVQDLEKARGKAASVKKAEEVDE